MSRPVGFFLICLITSPLYSQSISYASTGPIIKVNGHQADQFLVKGENGSSNTSTSYVSPRIGCEYGDCQEGIGIFKTTRMEVSMKVTF